jgi:hypothetical protein
MGSASTIHLYTSTPPLTCDGRRESQHVDIANATKSSNWWKGLGNSLIHFNTPTHVWRIKGEEQLRPGREPAKQRPGRTVGDGHGKSQHVDTKGGNSNFYNKLRKPGLELETLSSDTMLSFMH